MKNKKNLMVLVLLALFMSLGVADSKVTTDNNASNKDDPWGLQGLKETLEEADTLIARNKEAKAAADKAKAENEAEGSMEEIMAKNKEATAKNKEATAKNKEATAKNKEATARNKEATARNKEARKAVASH